MKRETIFWVFLGLIMLVLMMIPIGYWWENDHLTQIQILKQFWSYYIIIIAFYLGLSYIGNKYF